MKKSKFNSCGVVRALLAVAVAAIAGCGGGDQVQEFRATRLLAFGDESSVITGDGRKYTVNAVKSDNTTFDCAGHAIAVQSLAGHYGIVFPQCNPSGVASPGGRILASAGAKVADVQAQIDAYLATDRFGDRDLATVFVGANDIVELYRQFPSQSADALFAAAEARGTALAEQVNRIARAGARVVVATVFKQGQTPFAIAERARNSDRDRAELLTQLTERFNTKLRVTLNNDGRKIALVLADERITRIVDRPSDFDFVNVTQAACLPSAPLPDCSTQTLTTSSDGKRADGNSWLWADDLHLSAGGQRRFGEQAVSSATNNPF